MRFFASGCKCPDTGPEYFTSAFRLTNLTVCAGEYYADEEIGCTGCLPGKYSVLGPLALCALMANMLLNSGSKFAINALQGTYLSDNGNHADDHDDCNDCEKCESGKFSHEEGLRWSVQNVRQESLQGNEGAQTCIECPPGKEQPALGQPKCALCKANTYSTKRGVVSCTTCVSPTTTLGTGASNCSACIEQFYWDPRINSTENKQGIAYRGLYRVS